ncbi:MAG: glycosyl transferase, partial [Clostridiaceae bacterium]|nr:glycosyl transferase [Clostridiaceae bacterium]
MYEKLAAREVTITPEGILKEKFKSVIKDSWNLDAMFMDSALKDVIGVANLPFKAPAVLQLLKNLEVAGFIIGNSDNCSVVIVLDNDSFKMFKAKTNEVKEVEIPASVKAEIKAVFSDVTNWAGRINENGEHVIDLRTPSPGPHFYINLLLGNRVGYEHALQTTPKSVVDRVGRGSFRSHAATQVLATRWDMRQEENGFPANRQFYLVEGLKKIFYSADPNDANIESATCTHSQNHTIIEYSTKCGLYIKRTIFVLPQMDGMPLATEVQRIEIKNLGDRTRNIKLVYTGMFGPATPHAIFEDVVYTNVIMQSSILRNNDGSIMAIGPDYYPEPCREDFRFSSMLIRNGSSVE